MIGITGTQVVREMRNLRGPAQERTVHEWADRLSGTEEKVVSVANCPEHGLHGQRNSCFECGGPVEQIEMVPLFRKEEAAVQASGMREETIAEIRRAFDPESIPCPHCGVELAIVTVDDAPGEAHFEIRACNPNP